MDSSRRSVRRDARPSQPLEELLQEVTPSVRGQELSKTFKRRSANLRKSLQLLDESVGSPTPVKSRTPGGTLLRHAYTPKQLTPGSKLDVSGIMGHTPQKGSQSLNKSGQLGESFQSSFIMTPSKISRPPLQEDITEEITTTNVALLLEEDPGISASQGLFEEFYQCMQTNPSQNQAFDLVGDYENVCREQVTVLNKLVHRASRQEDKFRKTYDVLNLLTQERNTWQLIRSLFKDRLETAVEQENEEDEAMAVDHAVHYRSDLNVVSDYFKRDATIRQSQLVVDWLENCEQEKMDTFSENVKFFSDRAVAWENTLHRLQQKQQGLPYGTERPMVDEMDPDAPLRQNKLLDDLDKEDEARLLQYVFVCIRAGQLDKAQQVCTNCGQSWRAATLEGWRLHHDSNYEGLGPDSQVAPIQGNPYRDIWKSVCWKMAQEPKFNLYEKAIYGIQSGNLRAVLPVCKSWSDYVWAYFKVLVDTRVEQEIRMNTTSSRSLESLPTEYLEKMLDPASVFQEVEASEAVQSEAHNWFCVLQKHVILGDIDSLIEVMYQWVKHDEDKLPKHLTRFMAHLVLFLRSTELRTKEELCNAILEGYVEDLIHDRQKQIVAHYVATLPQGAQIVWYARFLESVTSKEERQECLALAEEAGLDIPQVTKTVVENIRNKKPVDFDRDTSMAVDTTVSEEDRQKIEAIDWLVFDAAQRSEAMKQANAVMRSFIAVKKLGAAREVFDKLPPDSVDVVYKIWHLQTASTELPPQDENAIREYMCIKSYLDAMESFNDWFNLCHHGKPSKPGLSVGANFTDRVAYEHRMKQFDLELQRWHHNLMLQTNTTKDRIYNVLLFTDGGWMVDQREEEEPDDNRSHQMALLRRLLLPGLCFLLHNVLHTSEQYAECMQLADVVASDQHRLYRVFRKDELQHLLHLLRDSSLQVLDQNKDPLGYELV